MSGVKRARLSCPWCPWLGVVEGPTIEFVTEQGQRLVEEHTRETGHAVIKGRKPRTGYFQGRPIS